MTAGLRLSAGKALPLGAHTVLLSDGVGTNFSVWAPRATRVELCLFDDDDETRYEMPYFSDGCWHCFLHGAGPGTRYGYRAYGEYQPEHGQRFNPSKLLIDPYTRLLDAELVHDPALYDYRVGSKSWRQSSLDSATFVPKGVVVEDHFDWQGVKRPATPLSETIIYELNVRGFTRLHPDVPPELRGTYLGLAHPAVVNYLRELGITAVELLPCASFISEPDLVQRGLFNFWGYNTINFFAPHRQYAVQNPVVEFQTMVRELHRAGIEVLLDVVYNHTAEGDARGPTLSFRGLDNEGYYLLRHHDRSSYVNNSGCGNSLDSHNPPVLRLVADSLRYWSETLHVDGFRFDLAPSLARVKGEFDSQAPFLQALFQDPVLSGKKLIAEPWDVGHAGYRLGQFPLGWSEWNDRYRKTVRSFWRGDNVPIGRLAARLSGSSDIFPSRGPGASINYVTAHDGFTLLDLVSYQDRHNQANGENNADGEQDNRSWNHGVEGPSSDQAVIRQRARDRRNLLATLLFSQGVPMMLGGDEIGRSQQGNNNAYCQDNAVSWIDWSDTDDELADFVRRLIVLRKQNPVFSRGEFLVGRMQEPVSAYDVLWLTELGTPMQIDDWHDHSRRVLAVLFRGDLSHAAIGPRHRVSGNDALLLVNGDDKPVDFVIAPAPGGGRWRCAVETAATGPASDIARSFEADARSLALLLATPSGEKG